MCCALTPQYTASAPYSGQCTREVVTSVGGHGGLDDLQRLTQRRNLEQVETGAEQQVRKLDWLLLYRCGCHCCSEEDCLP